MLDPVVVVLPRKGSKANLEQVVEREYADANELKIIDDAPLYQHGRLRGVTRKDGRPLKPPTEFPLAIPTPTTVGTSADDATTPQEAKK